MPDAVNSPKSVIRESTGPIEHASAVVMLSGCDVPIKLPSTGFLHSYTILDSLPREWCPPQWVGQHTSLNIIKIIQTSPQADLILTETTFLCGSRLVQVDN